ncbi:sugar ABC transporter ATP-binding protein [Geodermatophilus ruber]|uniref:Monosaccharide ABC transporter ATP-binding protein, CUT2 family n=1 Tax=Geodermatophilus ruber TaxID=504800 RepID=A0A1I4KLG5_9ACTN|nr:sugar ABC transporter ATP-binding protein [Geodermatophilus ruber]SFL79612.1 monosaccharide ABC transporter ATP-binding protein, CUT2 family [Geodermatophilus ruber]
MGVPASGAEALSVHRLSKTFGPTRALSDVDLVIEGSEVHALVGHNGSGKSTLIKILAGYQDADPGASVRFGGQPVDLPVQPSVLRQHRVRFVHQHLGLVERLTVAENLWLEQLALGTRRRVDFGSLCRDAAQALEEYGLPLDPREPVHRLTAVQKANLAILRAVIPAGDGDTAAGLLVLDEPTAFLPPEDKRHVYEMVGQVTSRGTAVLFVSHFLDEVLSLSDRVSVLRDGQMVVSGAPVELLSVHDLMRHIVGSATSQAALERPVVREAPHVHVRGLRTPSLPHLDLDIAPGEVVGLTGLLGCGVDEVARGLFGGGQARGHLDVDGRRLDLASLRPARAMAAGIAFVPADRAREGVCVTLPVTDNSSITVLPAYRRAGALRRRAMRSAAARLARTYAVHPPSPDLPVSALSGGNAQKVLMAKWLRRAPRFLILEEPTQGVDVGARAQIEASILAAAAEGAGVLLTSSDPEQLADLCHRVLVLSEGRVVEVLQGESLTKHRIAQACLTGGSTDLLSATTDQPVGKEVAPR